MMLGHLIRNRHLLLTIDEHNLSCSIIKPSSGIAPYELVAYQRYNFSHHEIMHSRFFNISKVSHAIATFIKAHHAYHTFVSCALNGPGITQLITHMPEPTLSATMLLQHSPDPLIWDSCYLYANDHAQHTFYACGIPRELLLQYQLLTRMAHITFSTLTSSWYAHLQVYKKIQGPAFRRARLGQALTDHYHNWDTLLHPDVMRRLITIPAAYNTQEELPFIRTALGLFIMGNSHG